MSRVLSSEEAKTVIDRLRSLITGGFTDRTTQDIMSAGGGS